MKERILIVEDKFVEADAIRLKLKKAGYEVTGMAHSVAEAREMIELERPDFVLLDIFLKGKLTGIDLASQLAEENIPFVYLSANSNEEVLNDAKATQPYGFLVKPFREKDLLVTLEIARYRHEHSMESKVRKENILKEKLLTIINNKKGWKEQLLDICRNFPSYISFDLVTAGFNVISDTSSPAVGLLRIGYDEYQQLGVQELLNITRIRISELIKLVNNPFQDGTTILIEKEFEQSSKKATLDKLFWEKFRVNSKISFPLQLSNGDVFEFCFYSRKPDNYNADHLDMLDHLQKPMTVGIESMLGTSKLTIAEELKESERSEPSVDLVHTSAFEGTIGKSHLLLNVFDLIAQVAPSNTSVLILGESGTGKERTADCIHNLSPRKNRPFVKVDCAALPSTLIESELFGHEKGAFTGAKDKRVGKFEKADTGTIFLDEIGEIPLDLQVKLLRVLQEKYIERIGSRDATKVDVRIIAATNRNLEKEVAEGRFRLDLYYRLNVFPIELPPLRERTEDIPDLANYFISVYNHKAGKKIKGLSDKILKAMMAYHWPGNIRQLENVIERGVLLAKGTIIEDLHLPAPQKNETVIDTQDLHVKTIHENERDYIVAILKKCNGRIWGSGGAAELLKVPPSTLKSKMKKLGIEKQ